MEELLTLSAWVRTCIFPYCRAPLCKETSRSTHSLEWGMADMTRESLMHS